MARKKKVNYEKVPLLLIYREGREVKTKAFEENISNFELYGFLKLYSEEIEYKMATEMGERYG